jgi:hypothetical protein
MPHTNRGHKYKDKMKTLKIKTPKNEDFGLGICQFPGCKQQAEFKNLIPDKDTNLIQCQIKFHCRKHIESNLK